MKQQAKAFVHCHSDHSLKDSPLKIKDMVERAVEMGAEAITLTDHGTATGIFSFMETCTQYGIKGIPGIEAYMESEYKKRAHLLLIAKNYEGYQEICRAVTESNEHLQNVGGIMTPVMNKEILKNNFGNGNVIATTACVSGIIAAILLGNQETKEEIEKLNRKIKKYNNPDGSEYLKTKEHNEHLRLKVEQLSKEKNILEAISKKTYAKRKKGLEILKRNILSDDDRKRYEETKKQLENEIKESENASRKLPSLKKELAQEKRKLTLSNQKRKEMEATHENYREIKKQMDHFKENIPDEKTLLKKAEQEILWYKGVFGTDFYAEVQYHGLSSEEDAMPKIVKLAKKHNIPLVASNDVHIAVKEQAEARAIMKALRFKKWEEPSKEDMELYMKSDKELYDSISRILTKEDAATAMENIKILCDSCNVVFPDTEHYPKYRDENGNEVEDAGKALRDLVYSQIPVKYPDGFSDYERLEYELETIISLGYANYTLIVADFIRFANNYGKNNHFTHVGEFVGPGRGSGAGSVANYLSGITNIDPLRYGLKFERYLNKDRVSMPDIDTDFSEEVREATIRYVTEKYGNDSVAFIRTCMTQGAKAAVDNSARVLGYQKFPKKEGITKEELDNDRRTIKAIGDRIKKVIPDKPGIKLQSCMNELRSSCSDSDASIILDHAFMVEGTATGLSVHAAGIIIGDGAPLKNYVPLLYNTEKRCWAVQCDMVEAERLHLLKMDFLGLINLDIITECVRRIKINTGVSIDLSKIPFEKEVFMEIYAKGNTSNVFQFESGGMKQMLRKFQPENFDDIILLVALYRPGPMDFIPDTIEVKHGRKKPVYVVPQMEEILAPTYGQPVYQEQLMDIFHLCAGFSLGEADIIRRYMSKKKEVKFLEYKPQFIQGLMKSGATDVQAENTWNSLADFSKYAFNKSHAAAYAVVSYQTAWLKYHYPVEFMCATLNHTDIKKIPAALYECSRMGIKVLPPDINKSLQGFEDRNGKILYGLGMIKGIKGDAEVIINERKENGFFLSLKDFVSRMQCIGKNTEKLIECGAFDSFMEGSRNAMLKTFLSLSEIAGKIKDKNKQADKLRSEMENAEGKDKLSVKKRLENAEKALENRKGQYQAVEIEKDIADNNKHKLAREYELLGAYISGHPLDSYKNLYKEDDILLVNDFMTGRHMYAGMVTNIRTANRKADGREMAFFSLEDMTGSIQVSCFADKYEKYHNLIQEGSVVKIYGNGTEDKAGENSNETERKLTVYSVHACRMEKIPYLVGMRSMDEFMENLKGPFAAFIGEEGHPVYFHNATDGSIKRIPFYVKENILDETFQNAVVIPLKKL